MISAALWVKRGFAAPKPRTCALDQVEMVGEGAATAANDALSHQQQLFYAEMEVEKARAAAAAIIAEKKSQPRMERKKQGQKKAAEGSSDHEMDVEKDSEESEQESPGDSLDFFFTPLDQLVGLKRQQGETHHDSAVLKEIREEEAEDLEVRETDSMIVALRADPEEDVPQLEVWMCEDTPEDRCNLYVHHDIMLPSFPLCCEWIGGGLALNYRAQAGSEDPTAAAALSRNVIAVGTFEPEIELWDLDLLDAALPLMTLKQMKGTATPAGKQPEDAPTGHSDAVMSMAWNALRPGLLLSSSADGTVILWNLMDGLGHARFTHHISGTKKASTKPSASTKKLSVTAKVQCVRWHPRIPTVFCTAAFDRRLCIVDAARSAQDDDNGSLEHGSEMVIAQAALPADPECLSWLEDPLLSNDQGGVLAISLESGCVQIYRFARQSSSLKLLGQIEASPAGKTISALDWHPHLATSAQSCPASRNHLLLTAGLDKCARVWAVSFSAVAGEAGQWQMTTADCLAERKLGEVVGKVFTAAWNPDNPFLALFAGSRGRVVVWGVAEQVDASCHGRMEEDDNDKDGNIDSSGQDRGTKSNALEPSNAVMLFIQKCIN